jgi:hypothetical protein
MSTQAGIYTMAGRSLREGLHGRVGDGAVMRLLGGGLTHRYWCGLQLTDFSVQARRRWFPACLVWVIGPYRGSTEGSGLATWQGVALVQYARVADL